MLKLFKVIMLILPLPMNSGHADVVNPSLDTSPSIEDNSSDDINNDLQPDIFDPRTWDALDSKMIDILVQKGPKRDLSIEKGQRQILQKVFCIIIH